MEKIQFQKRDILGKKSKLLASEKLTPAVVYNSKGDSRNISLSSDIAGKISREATSTTIYDADYESKGMKVVIKEIDINPITEVVRHIAFFEIDENQEMVFTIPFELVGISPAVKNNLGVLIEVMNSIDVKCKASDLISFIEIDISKLDHPGQSIAVEDLNIPEGIELVNEELKHATVVTVTELQSEEVTTPSAEITEGAENTEATSDVAPKE